MKPSLELLITFMFLGTVWGRKLETPDKLQIHQEPLPLQPLTIKIGTQGGELRFLILGAKMSPTIVLLSL